MNEKKSQYLFIFPMLIACFLLQVGLDYFSFRMTKFSYPDAGITELSFGSLFVRGSKSFVILLPTWGVMNLALVNLFDNSKLFLMITNLTVFLTIQAYGVFFSYFSINHMKGNQIFSLILTNAELMVFSFICVVLIKFLKGLVIARWYK